MNNNTSTDTLFDTIVIGGGAAGLMCGRSAGLRGKNVLILEGQKKIGKKIIISGGGKCNFTNYFVSSENYISNNIYFPISALQQFTQYDFLELIEKHNISFHERKHGQLFCDISARDIVNLLHDECRRAKVTIVKNATVLKIDKKEFFTITTTEKTYQSKTVVVATGGLSLPETGSNGIGYTIAKQFDINVIKCTPALVPLTLKQNLFSSLSGISVDVSMTIEKTTFREQLLFTHKGISGPVVLQISNYWKPSQKITIDFLPDNNFTELFSQWKKERPKAELKTLLSTILPKRLISILLSKNNKSIPINQYSNKDIQSIEKEFHSYELIPSGTEGYKKAEATLGGIDTKELSSKTMESKKVSGLYFIGETVDVTGWLGGYNFQWAWSSGYCAGQYL